MSRTGSVLRASGSSISTSGQSDWGFRVNVGVLDGSIEIDDFSEFTWIGEVVDLDFYTVLT